MAYNEPIEVTLCSNKDGNPATRTVYSKYNFFVGKFCDTCADLLVEILTKEEGIDGMHDMSRAD